VTTSDKSIQCCCSKEKH